jgi:hypothetical protein
VVNVSELDEDVPFDDLVAAVVRAGLLSVMRE